jgi:hypothetical protein
MLYFYNFIHCPFFQGPNKLYNVRHNAILLSELSKNKILQDFPKAKSREIIGTRQQITNVVEDIITYTDKDSYTLIFIQEPIFFQNQENQEIEVPQVLMG